MNFFGKKEELKHIEVVTAWCMRCKLKKDFHEPPMYEEKVTSRGKKAWLSGCCDQGHKMVKICKVRGE